MKKVIIASLFSFVLSVVSNSMVNAVSLNNFTISSYDIDYHLSKDKEGRSVLKTTEMITAVFPDTDQNHGIERAVPKSYDGHPVSLDITSVKDETGNNLPYTTYESSDNEVIRIGDKDQYVHGTQTYVISYNQRDVTRFFQNTVSDEFYWDTNGTEWKVPIQNFSVKLSLDKAIAEKLTQKTACYQGVSSATSTCELTQNSNIFEVKAQNLASSENITIAIGFQKDTFSGYKKSLIETLGTILVLIWFVSFVVALCVTAWLSVKASRISKRKKEMSTIIPEYIPPKDTSVTVAAALLSDSTKTFAAQLIDFAVRHYIKIYEIDKKWIFGSKDYELEIIKDITDLKEEEQEVLKDIFGGRTSLGERLKMSSLKNNTSVYMSTLDNPKKLETLMRGTYGLKKKNPEVSRWFNRAGWTLIILSVVLLSPAFLVPAITAFIIGATLYVLSDKGLEVARYLEGLKLYIKVAEVDRLKMLQSPEGAERVGSVDSNDPKQLVKLYERVLPYAILFGQEKEWNNQLGKYYESLGGQPDWYSSNNAVFSAAVFSSAMSSFSTASSYTAASSSSSGGSSGGGSSGGGGGGGGGGGW